MIKRIWLKNYGPFKSANLTLGSLTVLVGPNASGKSIAITALRELFGAEKWKATRFLTSMRRRGAENADVEVGFVTENENRGIKWRLNRSGQFSRKEKLEEPAYALLIRLEPVALRKASYSDELEPVMREDGYGLATVLENMILSQGELFSSLVDRTQAIVPTFDGLRVKRAKVNANGNSVIGSELVVGMKQAPDLPASAVSDGTLMTLGLLTMLMTDPSESAGSSLVLIDELERGLHPRALLELVNQLRRLTAELGIQILATSHSPYLVDALRPEEVRLTGLLEDGTATICNLTDHPDFERWKEEMSPGEFWSTVGEDWIK